MEAYMFRSRWIRKKKVRQIFSRLIQVKPARS